MHSFPCSVTEISFLTYYIQHSSSSNHAACESELPTGSLLPADLLKDLNSHGKTPANEVIFYVTVTQPPTEWLPGCLAAQRQGAEAYI